MIISAANGTLATGPGATRCPRIRIFGKTPDTDYETTFGINFYYTKPLVDVCVGYEDDYAVLSNSKFPIYYDLTYDGDGDCTIKIINNIYLGQASDGEYFPLRPGYDPLTH